MGTLTRDIELNRRREISKQPFIISQQTTIYLLTTESQLNSRLKKKACCHSLVVLNRASDVPAADWLSQTHIFLSGGNAYKALQFI